MLYTDVGEGWQAWMYLFLSSCGFMIFNDTLIYWIHRALHTSLLYKRIHKDHHKWIVPTPFASHAFHPLDGWAQSLPYHTFVFLVPFHKVRRIPETRLLIPFRCLLLADHIPGDVCASELLDHIDPRWQLRGIYIYITLIYYANN